jgi:type VI secretion system protein ImpH
MAVIPIASKFNLFQQIRLLLRTFRKYNSDDEILLNEKIRIASGISLAAPEGEVEKIHQDHPDHPIHVVASKFGLTGTYGALPTVYTEWLINCYYALGDSGPKAFFDIFDHRLYCLNYLAWKKTHLYAAVESAESFVMDKISSALNGSLLSRLPCILDSALHVPDSSDRSMIGLERWLSCNFNTPVAITPFTGGWSKIRKPERCLLGPGNLTLGNAPVIGSMRLDRSVHFTVSLGPMTDDQCNHLIKAPSALSKLKQYIYNYVGPVLDFSIFLIVKKSPESNLPLGHGILGQSICLGSISAPLFYRQEISHLLR